MKTTLLLSALFLSAPLFAAENNSPRTPVTAHAAESAILENPLLQVGSTRDDVLRWLGDPSDILSREVWIYRHYTTNHTDVNARGFDTLVLTFAKDKVSVMRLVDSRALDALIARVRLTNPLRTVSE